jgi:hypothetical protein
VRLTGGRLLDAVAQRIVIRYLRRAGASGVMAVDCAMDPQHLSGVDIVYTRAGNSVRAKVKPDAYFGTDARKISDQSLPFYRGDGNAYAFETISHHVFNSTADELLYYFLALGQSEDVVGTLANEPDEVFFSELAVERDDLHVIPMAALRDWFESNQARYTPRPVMLGDHSGWYRIVPVSDIASAVPGLQVKGSVFAGLAQG